MPRIAGRNVGIRAAVRFIGQELGLSALLDLTGGGDLTSADQALVRHEVSAIISGRGATLDWLLMEFRMAIMTRPGTTYDPAGRADVRHSRRGRPSSSWAADVLREIDAVVRDRGSAYPTKVTAYLLWLYGGAEHLAAPRADETSARYVARVAKAIEKRTSKAPR